MPPHWSQCCDTPVGVEAGGVVVATVVVVERVEEVAVDVVPVEVPVDDTVVVAVELVRVGTDQGAHCALGIGKV